MNAESLIPTATSIGGGFFIGIMLGYFVKKIFKILMFVAGGLAALLFYLQQQQIISVNLEKLEDSITSIFTTIISLFDNIPQIVDTSYLGIPMVGGLSAGFAIGLIKG